MFGLFKKKKEEPKQEIKETPVQPQSPEIKEFAADFLPEETDILAVTGPAGFSHDRIGESGLWKVTLGLTAWMDEYTNELKQGLATLETIADDKLLEYLLSRVPRNFIISVTVRPSTEGNRFMMTDLPKPGFDADLKAILDEQKKPITLDVDGLGTFTLSRTLGWFETTVDWLDSEISLTFDQAEETHDSAQETARALMADQSCWDDRVRAFAADSLLDKVNTLLSEEDTDETISREEFIDQLALDSVLAGPDGTFEFWFSGEDFFLAHPVRVSGDLEQGPTQAEMDS